MAARKQKADESLPTLGRDLVTLVIAYVKQETVDPLKHLGRFLGLGLAGVIVGSIGGVFLLLAGIRALQTETGTAFTGNLSFLPYVFALILCGAVAGITAKALGGRGEK